MKKIRILNKLQRVQPGGMMNYVFGNMKYIDRTRFQMDILSKDKNFLDLKECQEYGYCLQTYSAKERENRELLIQEMRTALEGYDVFHIHTAYWLGFLMEEIAMDMGIEKVMIHSHNSGLGVHDIETRKKYAKMHEHYKNLLSLNEATHFCACSMEAANWLYGPNIPKDQIIILKNAIEVERFSYNTSVRQKIRNELGIDDKFVVGHSGRFERQKNHIFLLEAFAKAYQNNPKLCLLLLGEGLLKDDIEKQIKELKIENAVIFAGWKENCEEYMQAMDLFVLPSLFEGLPIVLVEAQTAGLHCLVADTVTKEADITGNVKYLSLETENWTKEILKISEGYDRKNVDYLIRENGYDIKMQIKVLEGIYSE